MWWNKLALVACTVTALPAASPVAHAGQASITCPSHPGTRLKYVGLFDGPPAELVQLQPDVAGATTGYNDVAYIFAEHRLPYVECDYRDGTSTTFPIRTPVRRCSYTLDAAGLVNTLLCR